MGSHCAAGVDPIRPSDTDSLRTLEQPLKVVGGTLAMRDFAQTQRADASGYPEMRSQQVCGVGCTMVS